MRSLLMCVALFACSTRAPAPPATRGSTTAADPAPPRSLYDRLGGSTAIEAVANDFVDRTTSDPRIKERFFNTDPAQLKRLLAELVCQTAGGPCKYSGRDMAVAHAGMDLVEAELDALVEDLVATLAKFSVPQPEQVQLLAAIGAVKPQVLAAPDKLRPIDPARLAQVEKLAGTLTDKQAGELLVAAARAGERGQRSYAEQLFTRVELAVGTAAVAAIAPTFREGAPPRITTPVKRAAADAAPQPDRAGSSEEDAPDPRPAIGSLSGRLELDGKPIGGLGVITLTPERGGKQRTPKTRVIEQRDKRFAPRILAVPVGSTVAFPNFDGIYHNVFSLSKVRPFDLGMYRAGELREVTFAKPGIVRLGCNIHASMAAYIVVVDAPHYVVVDEAGTFAFRSLAPGKYTVRAWGERRDEPAVSRIEIKPGANSQSFDLRGDPASGRSPDKFGIARR